MLKLPVFMEHFRSTYKTALSGVKNSEVNEYMKGYIDRWEEEENRQMREEEEKKRIIEEKEMKDTQEKEKEETKILERICVPKLLENVEYHQMKQQLVCCFAEDSNDDIIFFFLRQGVNSSWLCWKLDISPKVVEEWLDDEEHSVKAGMVPNLLRSALTSKEIPNVQTSISTYFVSQEVKKESDLRKEKILKKSSPSLCDNLVVELCMKKNDQSVILDKVCFVSEFQCHEDAFGESNSDLMKFYSDFLIKNRAILGHHHDEQEEKYIVLSQFGKFEVLCFEKRSERKKEMRISYKVEGEEDSFFQWMMKDCRIHKSISSISEDEFIMSCFFGERESGGNKIRSKGLLYEISFHICSQVFDLDSSHFKDDLERYRLDCDYNHQFEDFPILVTIKQIDETGFFQDKVLMYFLTQTVSAKTSIKRRIINDLVLLINKMANM